LKNETIAEMAKDGLSYRFIPKDVITLLKDLPSNSIGWFFNESRDRYCAEWYDDDYIFINPSKVVNLFGLPVLFGMKCS